MHEILEQLALVSELTSQPKVIGCQVDLGAQVFGIPRLGDVREDLPVVDGADHRGQIREAGREDPLCVEPRTQGFEQLIPVHLRHPLVGDDHGDIGLLLDQTQRPLGRLGLEHQKFVRQQVLERDQHLRLVIYYQDRVARCRRVHGLLPEVTSTITRAKRAQARPRP